MIWFNKGLKLEDMLSLGKGTMGEHIGMEWVALGPNFLQGRIPVDHRTIQPFGLLHGGASCVLAETLGSVASYLVIDSSKQICVGIEINANHIRSARKGFVTGTATPIHIGNSTHVWDIKITDEEERLICISRLTVAVLDSKG
jgi:1,4-dihydroxy-2-naphthoyl-CoA hydrolase